MSAPTLNKLRQLFIIDIFIALLGIKNEVHKTLLRVCSLCRQKPNVEISTLRSTVDITIDGNSVDSTSDFTDVLAGMFNHAFNVPSSRVQKQDVERTCLCLYGVILNGTGIRTLSFWLAINYKFVIMFMFNYTIRATRLFRVLLSTHKKNQHTSTLCLKKVPTFKLFVILSNLNGFSKFALL